MNKLFTALLLLIGLSASAVAQPKPPTQTPVYSSWTQVGRAADISVTTSSFNEALGVSAPVGVVYNKGTAWAYVAPSISGTSAVTVANGIPVPPGSCTWINLAGQTNIAAIGSGATTLQIAVGYGTPGSCDSASSSSSSSTNPTYVTPGALAPNGPNQNNVSIGTVTSLTVPPNSDYGVIQAIGGTAYITYDGSTPSSSNYSKFIIAGDSIGIQGAAALAALKIVGTSMGVDYWH
jgi:hypothetical protein